MINMNYPAAELRGIKISPLTLDPFPLHGNFVYPQRGQEKQ